LEDKPKATVNAELLNEQAELTLYNNLQKVIQETTPLIENQQFTEALSKMASLQAPLDNFFDTVMVNSEDSALRENRLALLYQIRQLFLQIADISFLQST